jgi:NAD(P)-dependent dehydrogenase (short-subunit alcohol dehydrogenase family)
MTQGTEGKVVVITGGSSGLGEATARHLTEKGAIVAIAAREIQSSANKRRRAVS